jgi:hypothetical protein
MVQPGHRHISIGKARRNQQGIMGALLRLDNDLTIGQGDQPHSVDEIAERSYWIPGSWNVRMSYTDELGVPGVIGSKCTVRL